MGVKRILIVDDETAIVDLLNDVLSDAGFVVDSAETAEGALQLIRENIYDAAILDFNLPDMDGVMLHRQIRQLDAELASRSLFASGLVQADNNLGYYDAHGGGFIAKPFDIDELLTTLRQVLAGSPG